MDQHRILCSSELLKQCHTTCVDKLASRHVVISNSIVGAIDRAGLGTAIRSNHTANNYPLQKIAPQMALIAIVIYTNLLATHQRWGGKTEICNPCHRSDDWMSSQFSLVHYTSPRSGEESITTQITMPTSQFQNVRFKVLMETFLSSEEKNSVCNSCFML